MIIDMSPPVQGDHESTSTPAWFRVCSAGSKSGTPGVVIFPARKLGFKACKDRGAADVQCKALRTFHHKARHYCLSASENDVGRMEVVHTVVMSSIRFSKRY